MRSAISWLHWSGNAFNISIMTFEWPGDFPNFISSIDDSTILAVITRAGPIEGSIWDNEVSSQGNSTLNRSW